MKQTLSTDFIAGEGGLFLLLRVSLGITRGLSLDYALGGIISSNSCSILMISM